MTRYNVREATSQDVKRIAGTDMNTEDAKDTPVILLSDINTGNEALIIPSVGNQCIAYCFAFKGRPVNVLASPPNLRTLREQPVLFGNPILFPFPGRVQNGTFSFERRSYTLPVNDLERGHAIHGFVYNEPWKLMQKGADDENGCYVTSAITSTDIPDLVDVFPFPFRLEYTYRLKHGALHHEFSAVNLGHHPMPIGFGLHPWFRAPLSTKGNRGRCRVHAPVDHIWELDDLLPTGRIIPAPSGRNLSLGVELTSTHFDDVYAGLNQKDAPSISQYIDPDTGIEIAVIANQSFRELVIYAPAERDVLCIEPYTCTPDAFNLYDQGIDSGMIRLDPGESWSGQVTYKPAPYGG